jgi:hypothetical protein
MKKIVLGLMLLSSTSFASVTTAVGEVKKIENVSIAKTVKAKVETKEVTLTTIGAALRKKRPVKILPAVKVYVVQVASSQPEKFVRSADQALASFDTSDFVAVKLTFVRDVEAAKVSVAFRDALSANSVNLRNPEIVNFLKAVDQAGEAKAGKDLTILMVKNTDGTETVLFENNRDEVSNIKGPKGFSKNILSMWYGNTVDGDDELAAAKKDLISGL